MKHLVHHLGAVAKIGPAFEEALVREAGIVAAEHDLVFEAARDVPLQRLWEILRAPSRRLPEHVALVQADHEDLVGPRPAGVSGDDPELGKRGGQLIDRQRVRSFQPPPQPARRAGAHARGAHIYEDGNAELVDLLEQRTQLWIIDREVATDGMEVEADQAEVPDRMLRLLNRLRALPRIDRSPRVQHYVGVPVAKTGHIVVRAWGAAGDRLGVECDHQHLDFGRAQLRYDLLLVERRPWPVPVRAQGFDVRGDRVEPLHREIG